MGLISFALIIYGLIDILKGFLYDYINKNIEEVKDIPVVNNLKKYMGESNLELGAMKIMIGVFGGDMCSLLMFISIAGSGLISGIVNFFKEDDNIPTEYKTYVYVGGAVLISLIGIFR